MERWLCSPSAAAFRVNALCFVCILHFPCFISLKKESSRAKSV